MWQKLKTTPPTLFPPTHNKEHTELSEPNAKSNKVIKLSLIMKKNSKLEDTIKSVEPKIRFVENQFLETDTIQGHHRTSSYGLIHMQTEFLKHKQKAHLKKGQLQISKIDQNPKWQI